MSRILAGSGLIRNSLRLGRSLVDTEERQSRSGFVVQNHRLPVLKSCEARTDRVDTAAQRPSNKRVTSLIAVDDMQYKHQPGSDGTAVVPPGMRITEKRRWSTVRRVHRATIVMSNGCDGYGHAGEKNEMTERTRGHKGGPGMAASGVSRIGLAFAGWLVVAAWMPQGAAIAKPAIRRPPEKSAVTLPVANQDKGLGPAKIFAEKPIHDFGEKWIGPALDHTFLIKNDGKSTLEISSVRPSCGCTIAGKYPKKIAPGETGEFPFKIQSKKLRGKYEKSIKIYSNDPDTPELQLKLKGVCKRYVDVVPTNAYFGKTTTDAPRENAPSTCGDGRAHSRG